MTFLAVLLIRFFFSLPERVLCRWPAHLHYQGARLEAWLTGRCRFCRQPFKRDHVCRLGR